MKKTTLSAICAKLKEWFFIPEYVTREDILDATKPGEYHYDAIDIAIDRLATQLKIGPKYESKLYSILFRTITVVAAPATGWAMFLSWIFGRLFVVRIIQYMSRRCRGWNTLIAINYIYLGILLWIHLIVTTPELFRF